jgi:trehalose 6-phosphate phosphatase
LISGRAIFDLERHLGGLRLPLAGQHGLERRDAAGRVHAHAAPPAANAQIRQSLATIAARHPGLLLEDKGITLALHYRLAPHLASYVQRVAAQLVRDAGAGLEVQRGKCVAEIKPAGFNKGSAVLEYLAEPPFRGRTPVYIGDDLNDEHPFAAVNRLDGISIKVGRGRSCARFRLADVAAVRAWLGDALRGGPCAT